MNDEFMSVMGRIGVVADLNDHQHGYLVSHAPIESHGIMRPSALMLLVDAVVGMRLEDLIDDWTFTVDFSLYIGRPRPVERVDISTTVVRHGKRLLIERADYTDQNGQPYAQAYITFMRVPPLPNADPKPGVTEARLHMSQADRDLLDRPLPEAAGFVSDSETGRVEVTPHDRIRRPGGVVQGAIMTLLGEHSAELFATAAFGEPCAITDIDVRYPLGGRVGPLVAEPTWVGPAKSGAIRVEVRDTGKDNALTTVFLCRAAPLSTL